MIILGIEQQVAETSWQKPLRKENFGHDLPLDFRRFPFPLPLEPCDLSAAVHVWEQAVFVAWALGSLR